MSLLVSLYDFFVCFELKIVFGSVGIITCLLFLKILLFCCKR